MATHKRVLLVPEGYDGPIDPAFDEVRQDPNVNAPGVTEEVVPDDGATSVDRAFVTDERKQHVADAIAAYEAETDKTDPDPQVQIAELEKAVSFMWDVVSGEDIGAEATREANN